PTSSRNCRRLRISSRIFSATFACSSERTRVEKKVRASFTVSLVISVIERPATRTARASGRRRVPLHSGHVEFVFLAFEPIEKTLYAFEIVFRVAFEDQAALFGGKLTPGDV